MKHKRKVDDHKTLEADTSDHLTDTFRRALWYGKSLDFSLNLYIKKMLDLQRWKYLRPFVKNKALGPGEW
jgi:hypothetical protein